MTTEAERGESSTAMATRSASPSAVPAAPSSSDPLADAVGGALRPTVSRQIRDAERYQILGEHGRGGLGSVTRAYDRDLGRDIAIKELITRGQVSEVRFLREALITARLEHPGIVPIYEAGCWPDGRPFYAMKLVAGRSLRALIGERTTVEARLGLLHHVIAVADAIAYAHGRNIIHRDLKPANVIVGDFGETIVIDWGLAKDLTASDEAVAGDGLALGSHDGELTGAGSVLGTPAYMAPEQERGERVDQRADVFAIGAMLWELCALARVPPGDPRERRRILRRAHIDRDLITILDKALAPDPRQRYADAGALAADLKAFTAGARIAARTYGIFALLAHWGRRHRTLALAIAGVVGLAILGGVAYVRTIAVERDRADAAVVRVEAANRELTMRHAELLLRGDPTAAAAELARDQGADQGADRGADQGGDRGADQGADQGGDRVRRDRMIAEATARGIATRAFEPHRGAIRFLAEDGGGGVISLGADRTIQLTRGGVSRPLATDVSPYVRIDYAPATGILAYVTTPPGIAVLDLASKQIQRIASPEQAVLAFDLAGRRLAGIDDRGEITVWSTAADHVPVYRTVVPGAKWVWFAAGSHLVAANEAWIRVLDIDRPGAPVAALAFGVGSANAQPARIAIGSRNGSLAVYSPDFARAVRLSVCPRNVSMVSFLGDSALLAFACQDAGAGLVRYDARAQTMALVASFATQGPAIVTSDGAGRFAAVHDESNGVQVYDVKTGLVSRYEGMPTQVAVVEITDAAQPRILVGDVQGHVRIWDAPGELSRVVVRTARGLASAAFIDDHTIAVAGGSAARVVSDTGAAIAELGDYARSVTRVRVAPDRRSLLSAGYDAALGTWNMDPAAHVQPRTGHTAMVEAAEYIEGGRRIVSAGDDGRLLVWPADAACGAGSGAACAAARALFTDGSPLVDLAVIAWNDHAIVENAGGALFDVAPDGQVRSIRPAARQAKGIRASRDGALLAALDGDGAIVIYDVHRWQIVRRLAVAAGVLAMQLAPANDSLAVVLANGHVVLRTLGALGAPDLAWRELALDALSVTYSPDGATLAVTCAGGVEWLYGLRDQRWIYLHGHEADVRAAAFSPDSQRLVSVDDRGVAILHDVATRFAAVRSR